MGVFNSAAVAFMLMAFAGAAAAQTPARLPPNTLTCDGFNRHPDGTWHAGSNTQPFQVGAGNPQTVHDADIVPGSRIIGGVDLYDLLEAKCARR